jgi:AbrB family looped-hinge helix DNA binding protein
MLTTVTKRGQTAIPAKIRKKYGITPSTKLEWIEYTEGVLLVIPHPKDPISHFRGSSKKGLAKALLKIREEERKLEEKKGE